MLNMTVTSGKADPLTGTTFQEWSTRLQSVHNAIGENTARLNALLDRAHGTRPESAAEGGNPRAVPNGAVDHIDVALDDIEKLVAAQQEAITRAERIV
jgi:hypothetical protein